MNWMSRWWACLLLPFLAGCDPCSGLGSCGAPRVRYEGTVLRKFAYDPGPAGGVEVKFVRTGGVSLVADTVVARTDADGRFLLEAEARDEGQVTGDLWIYPPRPGPPVHEKGLRLATSRAPGEVRPLGEYRVVYPYLGLQVFLYHRATGAPLVGVEAEFRRTGGIPIEPEVMRVASDPRGYVVLRPKTSVHGEVVGDLTVHPLPPHQQFTLRGLKFSTSLSERGDTVVRAGLGTRVSYSAIVVWESTGKGIPGVEVEFRRTGGVLVLPERWVTSTDPHGTVVLEVAPLETGPLQVEAIIRPPAPGRTVTISGLQLKAVEDDRPREFLGFWVVPDKSR
jgi:hypothetical protein